MAQKSPLTKTIANYTDAIVTETREITTVGSSAHRARDRAAIQVEASRPRSPATFAALLDAVVADLISQNLAPTAALAAAGRAVIGTPWAGYRNGRNRLATLAASYLHWMVPDADWSFAGVLEVGSRRPLKWTSEGGRRITDVLDLDGQARSLVGAAFTAGDETGELTVVRLLRLSAPTSSLLYTTPKTHEPLMASPFWFEVR